RLAARRCGWGRSPCEPPVPLREIEGGGPVTSRRRRRFVEALEPGADPACRLTGDDGKRRLPGMERLFSQLAEQREAGGGNECVFRGDVDSLWEELSLFVDEESRCCPFFSYEQMEEPNGVILRVINPPAPAVQTDA